MEEAPAYTTAPTPAKHTHTQTQKQATGIVEEETTGVRPKVTKRGRESLFEQVPHALPAQSGLGAAGNAEQHTALPKRQVPKAKTVPSEVPVVLTTQSSDSSGKRQVQKAAGVRKGGVSYRCALTGEQEVSSESTPPAESEVEQVEEARE